MKRRQTLTTLTVAAFLAGVGFSVTAVAQQTTLRVFSGGANQRPDLMRKLFDQYQAKNPNVKIEIETGGATSELQRQYLSTVLNAKDPAIDIYLIASSIRLSITAPAGSSRSTPTSASRPT
jgi:ABC-type sugar transport system, periplasmic component